MIILVDEYSLVLWVDLGYTLIGRTQVACQFTSLADRLESCPYPWSGLHQSGDKGVHLF